MLHAKGAIFKEHLFLKMRDNNDAEIWKKQLHQRFQKIGAPVQSEEIRQNSASEKGRSSSDISLEISLPLREEIPRLPASIEELMSLRRKGCVRKVFRSFHLYAKAPDCRVQK